MNDYSDFPPIDYFKRVLNSSPQSAHLYAALWKHKAKTERISFQKIDIKNKFLISPTMFRNLLLAISRLELLSFEETPEYFLIDFYEKEKVYENTKS